ncbi:Uncharacterised protein [Enterobacter hormaechei]|nr:Uncharacterised protein [Enterobacter hormaechei]SAE72990.1 Uncharacterised protein [Enterobacter hormaechei]
MAVKFIRVFLYPLSQLSGIFREHSNSSYGYFSDVDHHGWYPFDITLIAFPCKKTPAVAFYTFTILFEY